MTLATVLLCFAIGALMPEAQAQHASRTLKPEDVFDTSKKIIYKEDFRGDFTKWTLSIDALYDPETRPISSDRVVKDAAPGLYGRYATRFTLPGDPGSFRAELALPAEEGLQERWYGARISVDQMADDAGYIVLQWHAVMGNDKVSRNFPNLAIHHKNDQWVISGAWGSPANIQRSSTKLKAPVETDKLTDWLIHAKWATDGSGVIEIWRDGELVYNEKRQNSYNLSRDRTPYLKTGIYRPSRKDSTTSEGPITVRVSDMRIGRADARLIDVSPVVTGTLERCNPSKRSASTRIPVDFVGNAAVRGPVGFIAPPQPGVTGAPIVLNRNVTVRDTSMFAIELTNKMDGKKRAVNIRGLRHTKCGDVPMNVVSPCSLGSYGQLGIHFDDEDNRNLPTGIYQGILRLQAHGWNDTAYFRTVDIHIKIFVTSLSGEVRPGTVLRFGKISNRPLRGPIAFVVPDQLQASGPTTLTGDGKRTDSIVTAFLTRQDSGARYPMYLRARRDISPCGKVMMNSTLRCPVFPIAKSDLEIEYRPADNPDLPNGEYTGSLFVQSVDGQDSRFQVPIAIGVTIRKMAIRLAIKK
ncbi:polysaccharide lyase [Cupriavidus pauculus]|uniref:polysaccharide lyase n=1 Tax=Cupriavidus pauculus TaxID=82633 RepID=UPI001EE2FAE7|nr:polysaccharide lyase [Cupriavidus pauculus]GJG96968.1 hypothetical protein CBA19C6_20785 [Cupriavidus pauculus]